jgi:hypothetical protein
MSRRHSDVDVRETFNIIRAEADKIASGNLSEQGKRDAQNEILKAQTIIAEEMLIWLSHVSKSLDRMAQSAEKSTSILDDIQLTLNAGLPK